MLPVLMPVLRSTLPAAILTEVLTVVLMALLLVLLQYQRSSGLGRKSRSMELYCKLQELLQGNPKISMESTHTVLSTEILKVFLRKTPCFATTSIRRV